MPLHVRTRTYRAPRAICTNRYPAEVTAGILTIKTENPKPIFIKLGPKRGERDGRNVLAKTSTSQPRV